MCLVETIIQLAANVDATHGLQMVLRILRIVRLTRALRLIKKLKTVMDILETLMVSMSVLVNVGGLLMIVFFIFAVRPQTKDSTESTLNSVDLCVHYT